MFVKGKFGRKQNVPKKPEIKPTKPNIPKPTVRPIVTQDVLDAIPEVLEAADDEAEDDDDWEDNDEDDDDDADDEDDDDDNGDDEDDDSSEEDSSEEDDSSEEGTNKLH